MIAVSAHEQEAGWLAKGRPLVLLFTGPSRTGKTEAAQQLSKIITGKPLDGRCFFNMGQFALEHEVAKLNGAAPGFKGNPDGELAFLEHCPKSVVILDEIEKAHPNARVFFLSVFDKGQFKTGAGRLIDCSSAIFVMTSNVGKDLLIQKASEVATMSSSDYTKFVNDKLRPRFITDRGWTDDFWNRINICCPFFLLSKREQLQGAMHFLQVSNLTTSCRYQTLPLRCGAKLNLYTSSLPILASGSQFQSKALDVRIGAKTKARLLCCRGLTLSIL